MSEPDYNAVIEGEGIEVEVGRIDHELKRLWEKEQGTATKASLINLAIYSQGPDALQRNSRLVAEITRNHSCRVILIAGDPHAPESGVRSWLTAHCHLGKQGDKKICSEQLSFLLKGKASEMIPSIVFSHLDSDLPLCFWWQGEFHDPIDRTLWDWVDRLIFDSRTWTRPAKQLKILRESFGTESPRFVLADLNWTRLSSLRQALAVIFDHPEALRQLPKLDAVEVDHAPDSRSTALYFVGWLAGQLGWTWDGAKTSGANLIFRSSDKRSVRVRLTEKPGAFISRCRLAAEDQFITLERQEDSPFFHAEGPWLGDTSRDLLLPAGGEDIATMVGEELLRGGRHTIYLRSVSLVEGLL